MKQERARDGRCGWERGEGREGRGDLTVIIIISIIIVVTTTTTTNIVYIAHNMTYDLLAIGHGGGMKKREKRRRGGGGSPAQRQWGIISSHWLYWGNHALRLPSSRASPTFSSSYHHPPAGTYRTIHT